LNILRNYIFHKIKQVRTFKGIKNSDTYSKSVNDSIYAYIDNNIIKRYELNKVNLYLEYKSLTEINNLKRYEVNYNSNIEKVLFTKYRSEFNSDKSIVKIYFRQEKLSTDFTFEYYFDILYNKI
jgi:hypothetical protein